MTSDRLPIIGAAISANQSIKKHANDIFAPNLIPGFWLFTGLGARGLTTVPLLAKIFLDEFLGEEKFSKNLIPEKIKNHVSSTRFLKTIKPSERIILLHSLHQLLSSWYRREC
jgi:hypothetical protein